MLLNNFKPLLFFGGAGTVVNVLGETVNIADIINSEFLPTSNANSHQSNGVSRSFNYNTTTATNGCVNEQTSYTWLGVTSNMASGAGSDIQKKGNGFVLFVGTGDTAVTANDYCLDTPISLSVIAAYCMTPASGIVTTSRTFENNTANAVTIKEIGLYFFRTGWNRYSEDFPIGPIIMIGRKVLDTPVTIPVNEAKTFEYIIDMNHITFQNADNGDLLRFQNV